MERVAGACNIHTRLNNDSQHVRRGTPLAAADERAAVEREQCRV